MMVDVNILTNFRGANLTICIKNPKNSHIFWPSNSIISFYPKAAIRNASNDLCKGMFNTVLLWQNKQPGSNLNVQHKNYIKTYQDDATLCNLKNTQKNRSKITLKETSAMFMLAMVFLGGDIRTILFLHEKYCQNYGLYLWKSENAKTNKQTKKIKSKGDYHWNGSQIQDFGRGGVQVDDTEICTAVVMREGRKEGVTEMRFCFCFLFFPFPKKPTILQVKKHNGSC